jgi:NADH-quinone oxidoreductase subunit D
MDVLAAITGNRVNYGMNTIGGVRRDITPQHKEMVLKAIDILEERTKYYIELGLGESTLLKRLSGVGKLTNEDVVRLGAVGPTARASGWGRDVRKDDPYAAYAHLDFKVITNDQCDVYGRTLVRLGELMEAYSMVRQILQKMPDGPIAVKAPRKIPAGEAVSRYEAPRGEDFHYVRSNGTDKPDRVKVRAPTLANVQAVSKMLEGGYLADMSIVVAAIDPCFSCTDRLISVCDEDTQKKNTVSWESIRLKGIDWYKNQGIDFTYLNKKLARKF